MEERWMPITRFENYEISDEGQVRNVKTGKLIRTYIDQYGNEQVCLYRKGKRYTKRISRLVATAFCDGYSDGLEVCHKDSNRRKNRADNLQWDTRSNIMKQRYVNGHKQIHRMQKIRCIETGEIFNSVIECSQITGFNKTTISKCINNPACKTYNGFHFERIT